jgi:transcriptional regulator with XRE-family HTH domain
VITGSQVRAARALIGLNQRDLANMAGIGEMTLKRFESSADENFGRIKTYNLIKQALENTGIIFIDADEHGGPGVRLSQLR